MKRATSVCAFFSACLLLLKEDASSWLHCMAAGRVCMCISPFARAGRSIFAATSAKLPNLRKNVQEAQCSR
jgi:hypothetical protein